MTKRSFCLGSEWLYYKIYTGVKTADIILLEKLYPIISNLKEDGTINKWFFIRYKDTDEHLRIRFNCDSSKNSSDVINALYPTFNELLENDIAWKIQTDTYHRELERYGEDTMIASEDLFYYDSEMIMDYIALKPFFITDETQLLFSFLSIDSFLNCFAVATKDKLKLMEQLQSAFKEEFNANKILKKELDKNYRSLAKDIDAFLSYKMIEDYEELYSAVKAKQELTLKIIPSIMDNLKIPLLDFLNSHIHMMVNRQYTSNQRMYECLIYDNLYRHYKMINFRN